MPTSHTTLSSALRTPGLYHIKPSLPGTRVRAIIAAYRKDAICVWSAVNTEGRPTSAPCLVWWWCCLVLLVLCFLVCLFCLWRVRRGGVRMTRRSSSVLCFVL